CTRSELQAQARHATGVEDLRSVDRERLVEEVGRLYDAYARVPDPLLLPYTLAGRRGLVDHSELTAALTPDQSGLRLL
ncbi:MAG: SAM-dependent methyltransferase, partial [Propionibacteriaceae bacterium]|nr:SAM-dependent methyltransferase [Propionibacteriaceae bacterium]